MRRMAFVLILAALTLVVPTSASYAGERVVTKAYLTGYSWYDNTPPGSGEIFYPRSDGHQTRHDTAAGDGTYENPITLAVGWSTAGGDTVSDWPVGKRFYIPTVRKYVIVEDNCGDGEPPQDGPCHSLAEAPDGASTWLDVWVGGKDHSRSLARSCMERLTGLHTVVFQPKATYPVNKGDITSSCANGEIYPDTVPRAHGTSASSAGDEATRSPAQSRESPLARESKSPCA